MRYLLGIVTMMAFAIACERPTARMTDYVVQGIDVSHYQSRVDWTAVAQQDIHFAFIKATEGVTLKDSLYEYNWDATRQAGIKRGAYHFFYPSLPSDEQARNFITSVTLQQGDLPPVLDVEVLGSGDKINLITGIRDWLYRVEIQYGIKPILYTNLKFYNKYLAGHFEDYPIWIARYSYRQPRLACGRDWQFWQYGNLGELDGIDGPVDFNVFTGSLKDLERLCVPSREVLSDG